MLSWVVTFLIVALIAGILGFGGIAGASIEIAKAIFFIAIILFLVSAVVGLARGRTQSLAEITSRASPLCGRCPRDAVLPRGRSPQPECAREYQAETVQSFAHSCRYEWSYSPT